MKRTKTLLSAGILILCSMVFPLVPSIAEGAVPQLINFQGILRDGSGNPVANGSYSATFKIYDAPAGGTNLWTETQSVTTTNGLFNAQLGAVNPVPDSVFKTAQRWLGIAVSPDPEMMPRQKLVSVPFSAGNWSLTGNAGTTPGINFLGTTDNQALELKANGQSAFRLEPVFGWGPNIIGGFPNIVTSGAGSATISGGTGNRVTDDGGTVGGGLNNRAGDSVGTTSDKSYALVTGGRNNAASGIASSVGGGEYDTANGDYATLGGGRFNVASGIAATVAGGEGNRATNLDATVGGGAENVASADRATVAGGSGNRATLDGATVGGGGGNLASGLVATVGGGAADTASGFWSTVPGGFGNKAQGDFSFAAGRTAKALHNGAFVWADGTVGDFASTADNQFLIQAENVGIGTNTPGGKLHIRKDVDGRADLIIENRDPGLASAQGILFNSEDGSGTSSAAGISVFDNSSSSPATMRFANNLTGGNFDFLTNGIIKMKIENGGNVGIGTSAPEQTLHVLKGSAGAVTANVLSVGVFENSASSYISILAPETSGKGILFGGPDNAVDGAIIYSGLGSLLFQTNGGGTRMVIDSNGNVGIGVGTPLPQKLHVFGNIRVGTSGVNGCVQAFDGISIAGTCASDARLKKDVKPFSPLLDKLTRLEPVTFNWRTDEYPDLNLPKVKDRGLIAQEVEKILPELVNEDENGFKAIHYHELPLMLLQAVKELKAENEVLKAEISETEQLEAELQNLKHLVEKLLSPEWKNVIQSASLEVGLEK